MKPCPKCQQRPIRFGDWAKGANAFSHHCDVCSAPLKANRTTWISLVLSLALTAVSLAFGLFVLELPVERRGLLLLLCAGVPLAIGGAIGYAVSGYDLERFDRDLENS